MKINLFFKFFIIFSLMNFVLSSEDFFSLEYEKILNQYTKPTIYKDVPYIGIYYNDSNVKYLIQKTVEQLKSFQIDRLKSKEEKMAFYINAYNIYVIYIITEKYPINSIMDLGKEIFDKKFVQIENKNYSLNEIEHSILRKNFNEPRIHFALVCGAISCPDIRKELYSAKKLNLQLEDQTKRFLSQSKGMHNKDNILFISSIFDWYKVDFGNTEENIIYFIKKYQTLKKFKEIKYIPYYWDLNIVR